MMLEEYLLRQSVGKLTASDFDRLEAICNEMDRTNNHQRWLAKNREFHEVLYGPSGAEIAMSLNRQVSGLAGRYLNYPSSSWQQRKRTASADHRRIIDAARAGDVTAASRELKQHIGDTRTDIGRLMAEQESDPSD